MKFTGKHVLVTGASRGIGRAIAMAFAKAGARVAVHYRTGADAAEETLGALPGAGHITLAADVANPADCERLVRETPERLGGLDILVNNAGIYHTRPVLDHDYASWQDDWNAMLATNVTGPANLCFLAAHYMQGARRRAHRQCVLARRVSRRAGIARLRREQGRP